MSQSTRTDERLLLIGCNNFSGIDSVEWINAAQQNIPDYDIVVVSVPHITEDFLQGFDINIFGSIKQALLKFLHSGGELIILLAPIISVYREGEYPDHVDSFDWCPLTIATHEETGQSIIKKTDQYGEYLNKMREWSFYISIPKKCLSRELTNFYGSTHNTDYKIPLDPYIENRYSRILAGQCRIEVRTEKTKGDQWGNVFTSFPDKPDHVTGPITLLPLIDGISPEEALINILQEEIGYSLTSPQPEWVQQIELPFVPELQERISDSRSIIDDEREKIASLMHEISELTFFKRLLYSSGTELENVVQKSLELMDTKILPAKYAQEEYILFWNDEEFLIEVKGVSKSITLKHLRQLNDYLLKYQEDTGKDCKGILIGNVWRNMPPEMRNKPNTPVFPDNVIQRAEQWGISLLSSQTLFDSVIKVLNNSEEAGEILKRITTTCGVVQLDKE